MKPTEAVKVITCGELPTPHRYMGEKLGHLPVG